MPYWPIVRGGNFNDGFGRGSIFLNLTKNFPKSSQKNFVIEGILQTMVGENLVREAYLRANLYLYIAQSCGSVDSCTITGAPILL